MFTVYMHVNKTNQKKYIGITSQKPEDRWGPNGNKYTAQYFSRAIEKYGWDNFDHYILCEDLAEDEAKQLEVTLIEEHNTFNPEFGYNCTLGGDGVTKYSTDEERKAAVAESKARSRERIKADPEKYEQRLEQVREFKRQYMKDPERHAKLLAANNRCHIAKRSTAEGRAEDNAASYKIKCDVKQIRNKLRDLYEQHPDLFSDEAFEIVFSRRQTPNKSWVFTYNSKKALLNILMDIEEKLLDETNN